LKEERRARVVCFPLLPGQQVLAQHSLLLPEWLVLVGQQA
jgi:hypothetical protein